MMMNSFLEKRVKRNNMVKSVRQNRTRFKLKKVTNRKRLTVFRSNNHIYAQVINDELGVTLASASSIEKIMKENKKTKKELAQLVGKEIAKRSIKSGIKDVAFDKGKYKYHGLIKILAEAAREAGLNF